VAAYHLSRHDSFGDYIPPSTSVVMERLFGASSTISTSLVAVMPMPGREIRKVYPAGVASTPTSGFVPAVVCDEFVFVAGQMAHNPGTGLDPRAAVPDHAAWAGIPIRRQTEFLIEHKLKPALEAAGSALGQSIKAQIYLADIADAGLPRGMERALRRYSVRPDGNADQIVRDSGRHHRDQSDCARQRREAQKGGDRGRSPRNGRLWAAPQGRRILAAVWSDGGRQRWPHHRQRCLVLLRQSRARGYTRAAALYRYVEALCHAAGTAMDRLLRAQYFVADVAAFSGIATAWSSRYSTQPHPFLCVQTPSPMPAPGCALIGDCWISIATP
jgi:enamine deaminase RidA (YjgF/YER057c/UK114 family)